MSLRDAIAEVVRDFPHLASPAALAREDTNGKWQMPRHLAALNELLLGVGFGEVERAICNLPFQHGKSWLCSHYFPAWKLLWQPDTRIILAAHGDRYAESYGSKVKEVIEKWGPEVGVRLRADTQAKGEWVIEGHEGGMVCKGLGGAILGRPADLLIIDDPIKDAEEAMSKTILDKHWDWYCTTAYSRLGPTAPVLIVTTRWCKQDLCGRILEEAKDTAEPWRVVKFKAIAEEDDPLGRQVGEALWPARVPLKRLEMIRAKRGKWFRSAWQQEPEEEEGGHFKPSAWPFYSDLGDAYSIPTGTGRIVLLKSDAIIFLTCDWAWSEKMTADRTAIGVWALTPAGQLLLLEVICRRIRLEQLAPTLAEVCRRWHPSVATVEVGHPTLSNECHRHPEIPEVRWMKTESKSKLLRALPAIFMGENKRIYLPDGKEEGTVRAGRDASGEVIRPPHPSTWLDAYCSELAAFTGLTDEHDDQVDMTSQAGALAQELRVVPRRGMEDPQMLVAGKEDYLA